MFVWEKGVVVVLGLYKDVDGGEEKPSASLSRTWLKHIYVVVLLCAPSSSINWSSGLCVCACALWFFCYFLHFFYLFFSFFFYELSVCVR